MQQYEVRNMARPRESSVAPIASDFVFTEWLNARTTGKRKHLNRGRGSSSRAPRTAGDVSTSASSSSGGAAAAAFQDGPNGGGGGHTKTRITMTKTEKKKMQVLETEDTPPSKRMEYSNKKPRL